MTLRSRYLAAWAAAVLCLCWVTAATAAEAEGDVQPANQAGVPAHWKHNCGLLEVCNNPAACPIMRETPPEQFTVRFKTNVGSFRMRVTTAWAPPFATRMWQLARLRYMDGARFYRVVRDNFNPAVPHKPPFVIQFGYNGVPEIDNCWDNKMTSNDTAPVVPPGNLRGYVSFSMGAVETKTDQTPYCTYPIASYCAIGFSQNIFINLANNTRLDGPGFAIFGVVPAEDMSVVDRIYGGYGEVTELCPAGSNSTYCNGYGDSNQGVSMDRLVNPTDGGNRYLITRKPLLSYIRSMELLSCKGKSRRC
uniref:Uncharacterized protein n=1 Tax=Tetradesmus obliquus TaxID=3088 RepID=A0A383V8N9_TETOB|eukprot:jgi/Sobl393_1/3625/SZX61937.1